MEKDFIKNLASRSTILRDFIESKKKTDLEKRMGWASKIVAAFPAETRRDRAARRILFRLLKMARSNKLPLE